MDIDRLADQLPAVEADGLANVLTELTTRVSDALGPNLVGVYLVGSFALGAGDLHSDVDFLVVMERDADAAQEEGLRAVHERMPDLPSHWAHNLEGGYAPTAELRGEPDPSGAGWLTVDNGSRTMSRTHHDDTAVFRWVLREHGIRLTGPEARTLVDAVAPDRLRREAVDEARARAAAIAADPSVLGNAWGQTHVVATMCRLLYTASEGGVVGKAEAATRALGRVPERWHPLIRRAIADRPDPWVRVGLAADPALVEPTAAFVAFVAREVGRR